MDRQNPRLSAGRAFDIARSFETAMKNPDYYPTFPFRRIDNPSLYSDQGRKTEILQRTTDLLRVSVEIVLQKAQDFCIDDDNQWLRDANNMVVKRIDPITAATIASASQEELDALIIKAMKNPETGASNNDFRLNLFRRQALLIGGNETQFRFNDDNGTKSNLRKAAKLQRKASEAIMETFLGTQR